MWATLVCLSLLGMAVGLYWNRYGVDVEPDSAVMMTAGLRFAHGEGVSIPNMLGDPKPMVWFPPVVSWVVGLFEWAGVDSQRGFGVLNPVLWGILIGWAGWLAGRAARGVQVLGVFAAGVILTNGAIGLAYGMLYSEPFFYLWLVGALAALGCWWDRPLLRWAALAGVAVGGALMTRYVGLTLGLLGGCVILLRPGVDWKRRGAALACFGVLSAGPMLGWHFWQSTLRHGESPRTLAWHPITGELVNDGIATLSQFILPKQVAASVASTRLIFALACLAAGVALWRWFGRCEGRSLREKLAATPGLVVASAVFMVIYTAFLVVSISIADADTPLDGRILSMLVVPGVFVAVYLLAVVLWEQGSRRARGWLAAAACGFLLLQGVATLREIAYRNVGVIWSPGRPSPTLDALCALPGDAVIYSNDPYAIYMAVRRKTETLPFALPSPTPGERARAELKKDMAQMREALARKGGWVVYWNALNFLDPVIDRELLETAVPVVDSKALEDGMLLYVAPQTPAAR